MKKTTFSMLGAALAAVVVCGSSAASSPNSQWRGDKRDGVYNETGLLKSWAAEGPQLRWHYDSLGQGHSSPSIAGDKIYITGMTDSTGTLYVFDLQGQLLNKKSYGLEWSVNYHGSRSTVTVDNGKLYVFSGRGVLYCMDEKTLDLAWQKDALHELDGKNLRFGMTESPLIVGDVIYLTPGGQENSLVALNKNTGALLWSSKGTGRLSAYCSPLYIGETEVPLVVTAFDSLLAGFDAKTGALLWSAVQNPKHRHSPNTPYYENGLLFSTSGSECGSVQLRITNGGRSVEEVWRNEMDNKMGGFVKLGNYVYGSGERKRYWYCVDWETGETQYKSDTLGMGNVIAADGMLYCYSDKGEMALVRPTPEKFDVVSRFKVTLGTEQHWAHPVIYKGTLFVRHGNTLMAYKVKG